MVSASGKGARQEVESCEICGSSASGKTEWPALPAWMVPGL
jgi:hypothetical protein